MVKDKRYIAVGHLIKDGRIKNFEEIFDFLPKTVLARDLGMNNVRFEKQKNNISFFRLKDLFLIAQLLEIDEMEIMKLAHNQYIMDKERKKKKLKPPSKG